MRCKKTLILYSVMYFLCPIAAESGVAIDYPWLRELNHRESIETRIQPPVGFKRIPGGKGSFASWLRGLPLRDSGTVVQLFDGRPKGYQGGVFAVVDLDVGTINLQQCADAVIRLRAEYLLAVKCFEQISFKFTSGHSARWSDWRAGYRPSVSGNRVSWVRQSSPDSSYTSFRKYLNSVFTYAGSYSLEQELLNVEDPKSVLPGDVFINGGFPGHAVLVADVAEDSLGQRIFLLVQSYMPAQDVHVLLNPATGESPWYPALSHGSLVTPEWTFSYSDLRRFLKPDCGSLTIDSEP